MKTASAIWSYFLLAAYAVVFGHQIIPHHHHDLNVYHNHHGNGVMDHCVTEKETHQHIAHDQHFDEGIWDFIGCLFGHDEHQPEKDCNWEQVLDKRLTDSQYDKNTGLIALTNMLLPRQYEDQSNYCFNNKYHFFNGISTVSLRGPPDPVA